MKGGNQKQNLRREQQFWKDHVHKWQRSGLSKAEYCRKNSINCSSFYSAGNRILKRGNSSNSDLVEIPAFPPGPATESETLFELKLENDRSLNVRISAVLMRNIIEGNDVSR